MLIRLDKFLIQTLNENGFNIDFQSFKALYMQSRIAKTEIKDKERIEAINKPEITVQDWLKERRAKQCMAKNRRKKGKTKTPQQFLRTVEI
jgi:hypothetical protein